jgi:hypothetical protein
VWHRWVPWRYLLSSLARAGGFIDPVKILYRFEAFSQPADIRVPLEMLRSGMVFHARGFLNTSAIQHNLDWVWPYWVERQYDPTDISFTPRSFLLTHINVTHRNWTAVGLPDLDSFPIVDPRGLLTPFWDGWSLDAWIARPGGPDLYPSRAVSSAQDLDMGEGLAVSTHTWSSGMELRSHIGVVLEGGMPTCVMDLEARGLSDHWLAISIRPYNPEGVSFINTIALGRDESTFVVDGYRELTLDPVPTSRRFSFYRRGDVHTRLFEEGHETSVECRVGMASAAALYPLGSARTRRVKVRVPLGDSRRKTRANHVPVSWEQALEGCTPASIPERRIQELYEEAARTLVLLCPGRSVYPGPYTYRRFWFRDAAFMLHALMCLGLFDRVERVLDSYPQRQLANGFFLSQEGEWDSNGEALWTFNRYCQLSGRPPKREWRSSVIKGARWILNKRGTGDAEALHAGLFPPGFSAEHLGPNDYYYWDDFWGVAGLRSAAELLELYGSFRKADILRDESMLFLNAIEKSLSKVAQAQGRPGMPASPYRRLDSGAVGSLVAGYPLQLFSPRDERLLDTADFLFDTCMVNDGFFLDIIHSGINPYLTLHLAQVFMRAGKTVSLDLVRTVADLASPTGQWPEAVHPRTLGGCMGDGNHAWAAAEWVLMVRNSFLREEGNKLYLGSGVFPAWYRKRSPISFGPAPTAFGTVSVTFVPGDEGLEVSWHGDWRRSPPAIEVAVPGFDSFVPGPNEPGVTLTWKGGT